MFDALPHIHFSQIIKEVDVFSFVKHFIYKSISWMYQLLSAK